MPRRRKGEALPEKSGLPGPESGYTRIGSETPGADIPGLGDARGECQGPRPKHVQEQPISCKTKKILHSNAGQAMKEAFAASERGGGVSLDALRVPK